MITGSRRGVRTATGLCTLMLSAAAMHGCGPRADIRVTQATYGANCGAAKGNATIPVAVACDGTKSCSYRVHVHELGDPAPGCAKNFEVLYLCTGEQSTRRLEAPAEAGLGSVIAPSCRFW